MSCCVAHIAKNDFITFFVIIAETNIANDAVILIVLVVVNQSYWIIGIELCLLCDVPR